MTVDPIHYSSLFLLLLLLLLCYRFGCKDTHKKCDRIRLLLLYELYAFCCSSTQTTIAGNAAFKSFRFEGHVPSCAAFVSFYLPTSVETLSNDTQQSEE